ncbi:DUF6059 family protein [Streptomyces sp. NPDC040724]|uniref:DUF6059 family protein n=1 Tax=unclassified Streptomyces TaxID=2593676 RepID=UPI0033C46C84
MAHRERHWLVRFTEWMQPGFMAFGTLWGLTPPLEWITADGAHPPDPRSPPGPGHPECLVPDLPPSPAERALWSQLTPGARGSDAIM